VKFDLYEFIMNDFKLWLDRHMKEGFKGFLKGKSNYFG